MKPFVVDVGTHSTKAGFSEPLTGERFPQMMVPTLLGFPSKNNQASPNIPNDKMFYGLEALKRSPILTLKYPVEYGIILDWDYITHFLEFIFECSVKEGPSSLNKGLLMTEPPLNPKQNRESLAEIVFEKFQVPFFQLSISALNALYTEGFSSGLVVESGEGITTCVPVYEGYVLSQGITRLDVGGRDVNEYLNDLLKSKAVFSTIFEKEFVRDIKEQFCQVRSANWQLTFESQGKKKYQLPDGKSIEIGDEQYQAPELLFNTSLIGKEKNSIQDIIFASLDSCEVEQRRSMFSHVVLAGGTTTFKGFKERLHQELRNQRPAYQFNLVDKPYRRYMSWMGASILASLNSFQPKWISKEEYNECGINIIHKKSLYM